MFDGVTEFFANIWQALVVAWEYFFGGGFVREFVGWMVESLPDPSPTLSGLSTMINTAAAYIDPYITLSGYFINIRLFALCVAVIIGIEFVLIVPRMWQWLLKIAPMV